MVTPPGWCHRGTLTNGPRRIPPYCVCSGEADTVTRGASKPLRLAPWPAPPVGPFCPAPPFAVWFVVVDFPSLLGGVGWWWWGGGSSPTLAELLMCVSPPLLAEARRWWRRVVPRHSWLGVLGVAPLHFWLEFSGVGVGVGLRHSWLRVSWFVGRGPSLLAEGPGWAFHRHPWLGASGAVPRHSWLGGPLVLVVGGPSPFPAEGPGCGSLPLLAGVCRLRWGGFPRVWFGGLPCCVCSSRGACWCVRCVFVVMAWVWVCLWCVLVRVWRVAVGFPGWGLCLV